MSSLSQIVPGTVAAAEDFTRTTQPHPFLYPQEAQLLRDSSVKRIGEFAAARACARRAGQELGFEIGPLLPGPGGAPQWPATVTGSLTHCDGYRAAVVGRRAEFRSIGLDAEPNRPLPRGVLGMIASSPEQQALAGLAASDPGVAWDKLMFSAKETVYKAWYPLTRQWLNFADATVGFEPDGHFTALVLGQFPLHGRWTRSGDFLVTVIAVSAA
jgi:4'-phosphopantetheinyl transferase EntD